MSALLCENFTVIASKITDTEACKDSYVPGAAPWRRQAQPRPPHTSPPTRAKLTDYPRYLFLFVWLEYWDVAHQHSVDREGG